MRQISFIDEDVWVALTGGIAILRDGETLEGYTPESSFIPSMFIHAITSDESSTVWMASSDGLIKSIPGGWQTWSAQDIGGESLTDIILGLAACQRWHFMAGGPLWHPVSVRPDQQELPTGDFPPGDFSLSAFALGEPGVGGWWDRRKRRLPAGGWRVVPPADQRPGAR